MEIKYEQQAANFLQETETLLTIEYCKHGKFFSNEKTNRDIYKCCLKNSNGKYSFKFGQSVYQSDGNTPPMPYDILSCLQNTDPETFHIFCHNLGYNRDSRSAFNTYKAVKREWENVKRLFTSEQIEILQDVQQFPNHLCG